MTAANEKGRRKTTWILALVVIAVITVSALAYFTSQWWAQGNTGSRENISIRSVSLRARPSPSFFPSLFANLSVSSPLSKWEAFVNGVRVFSESLNQENISNFYQAFGVEVKNVSVVLGESYTVTFKATFSDGFVDTVSTHVTAVVPPPSHMSFDSWELCSRNCVYPSPFFEALVSVNSSVPLSSLGLFINGTSQGVYNYTQPCCLLFGQLWKSGIDNGTMPITAGRTYLVEFVATFQDHSMYTATKSIVAS